MNAVRTKQAMWKYDPTDNGGWKLIHTASRNQRVLAIVRVDGSWQTFDMDGAGGESGAEFTVHSAKEEAEHSVRELGYL